MCQCLRSLTFAAEEKTSPSQPKRCWKRRSEDFPKLGIPFLGVPNSKDYSILGSILGSPNFGKLQVISGTAAHFFWCAPEGFLVCLQFLSSPY